MDCTGLLLVLACTIYSVSSQLALTTSGGSLVSVGDANVELDCTVTNLDVYSQVARWMKQNLKSKKYEPISNHNTVYSEFSARFSLAVTPGANNQVTFTLTLSEVQKGDDGFYTCVVVAVNKDTLFLVESTEELKVRQPISSVVLNADSDVVSASDQPNKITIELETFDPNLVLGCKVKGSNPEARIDLTIGGQSIISEVLRQDQMNIKGQEKYYRTYNTDLDSTGKKTFDESIIGKEITCSAWMEDGEPAESNPMTATIVINLKEPPKVECSDVTRRLGDKRVPLVCTIESIVKPEKITWYVDNNGDPLFVQPDGFHEEYSASVKELGENKYEVTLEIGHIEDKHFDNIYTLQAEVPGDDISYVVRLKQSMTTTTEGQSTGGVGTVSMSTTFFTYSMLIGCLLRRWI